jgi:hypothetical protein
MGTRAVMTIGLLLALLARAAAVEEHPEAAIRQVILGRAAIIPADLTADAKSVLQFNNVTADILTVTFVDPPDIATRVRCGLLKTPEREAPPWALFTLRDGKLVGTIPPGRLASLCSFAPGEYVYTVERLATQATGRAPLPLKGQVRVQ